MVRLVSNHRGGEAAARSRWAFEIETGELALAVDPRSAAAGRWSGLPIGRHLVVGDRRADLRIGARRCRRADAARVVEAAPQLRRDLAALGEPLPCPQELRQAEARDA